MSYHQSDFTHISESEIDLDIWQCINCGAHAETAKQVKHYETCKPGECDKWTEQYSKEEQEI